ncbi:MAG: outer membrane beta-barrel protein, partial [Candidatus Omnitrophica bacterium]|nr:outer membrane beta-barrel protein [Candidatus Omnitrophota bacterium]
IRYDVNKWLSFSNRTEYFTDPDGLRVVSGAGQDLWENTITAEIRPFKNIITRLEYRYDASNKDVFTKEDAAIDHQNTIAMEAIYVF